MRKPETCKIEYCGYEKPKDKCEIEFEILGLEQAVQSILLRISTLKQSKYLAEYAINKNVLSMDSAFQKEDFDADHKNIKKKK